MPRTYAASHRQTIIDAVCERLSRGEPLARICRDEGMPDRTTVWDWEQADPELAQRIARAREEGEDSMAADCLLIADDASGDYRMGERGLIVDTDHIQRSKLRIETRLKLLAKFNPKRWGDAVTVKGDKDNPLQVTRTVDLTEAQLLAIAAKAARDG